MGDYHPFILKARSALIGGMKAKDHLHGLAPGVSLQFFEGVLENLAASGNSDRPVAARFQTHPENVRRLINDDFSLASQAATRGGVPIDRETTPISSSTTTAPPTRTASGRLGRDSAPSCHAIERVPNHDGDKPLRPGCAAHERQPFPVGQWPRENPIPYLELDSEALLYNQRRDRACHKRTRQGLGPRDFESGVFCVPKSDGGFRLCADYREMNTFSKKSKFQMEGVQQVVELMQQNDYGMLIDLKGCYLTLGLHPAHRKHCRFRSPDRDTLPVESRVVRNKRSSEDL
jgi:hypothetical protein